VLTDCVQIGSELLVASFLFRTLLRCRGLTRFGFLRESGVHRTCKIRFLVTPRHRQIPSKKETTQPAQPSH
jgi:hypothetical protein